MAGKPHEYRGEWEHINTPRKGRGKFGWRRNWHGPYWRWEPALVDRTVYHIEDTSAARRKALFFLDIIRETDIGYPPRVEQLGIFDSPSGAKREAVAHHLREVAEGLRGAQGKWVARDLARQMPKQSIEFQVAVDTALGKLRD